MDATTVVFKVGIQKSITDPNIPWVNFWQTLRTCGNIQSTICCTCSTILQKLTSRNFGRVRSKTSVQDWRKLQIKCFHLNPFNRGVGVPHLSVATLFATLSMLGLHWIIKRYQKHTKLSLKLPSQYPPFTRSCSPACRVDRGEGWQTHSSCSWRWRCRSSQHGHYLKHHNLEEGGTEILWIIFTWGCWPAYGTLLESSCQRRIPRLYTSQALLGTSPFNNSGA